MLKQLRLPKRLWMIITLFSLFGLCVTLGFASFYVLTADGLRREATLEQENRASTIAHNLETYLRVAQQLAATTSSVISPLRSNQGDVEYTLQQLLASAPPETIYGIGAWFEPNVFTPGERYFGPYVHRGLQPDSPPILTYEWTTPDYNFHTQPWYQAGKQGQGTVVFTEPYFDTDLVYITAAQAFFDRQGRFAGVITVDMVLPQLHELIAKANMTADEVVYVTTARGALLAHPAEEQLLTFVRMQGKAPKTLLDVTTNDLKQFSQQAQNAAGRIESAIPIALAGWTAHVSSTDQYLFKNVRRLQNTVLAGVAILWLALSMIVAVIYRSQAQIQQANARVVASEKQYAALFNDAPYPIFVVDRERSTIWMANAAAHRFYQYTAAEFQQLTVADLVAEPTRASRTDQEQPITGEHVFEARHRKKSHEVAEVVITSKPMTIDGRMYHLWHVFDMTERNRVVQIQQELQDEIIRIQATTLAEMATPLIPIHDQVIVMPVIGTVDEQRAQHVMEALLKGVATTQTHVAIIDITGVPAIDTGGAAGLVQVAQAVRLLGARVALTGVRPEVAQALVALGTDLQELPTYSTLQQGIMQTFADLNQQKQASVSR